MTLLPLAPRPAPVPGPRRALAIVNPHSSGIHAPERTAATVQAALAAAGLGAEAAITDTIEDLRDAIAHTTADRLVLVGGDGALHAVANLGLPSLPEIALIPTGKANNIAHGLGIPTELTAAARLAADGTARAVDAIEVSTPTGSLIAVEGVSAGLHAAARARYRAENSGAVARGAFALAQTLMTMPHFQARMSIDNGPAETVAFEQVFLNTLPYFAFGLQVDPDADPSDGTDEAVFLHARSRHGVVGALRAAKAGRIAGRAGVEMRPWRSAAFLDPVPLAADAVPLGVTTARLRVRAGHLRVVTGREA